MIFDVPEDGEPTASLIFGLVCKRFYHLHWKRHGSVNLRVRPAAFSQMQWVAILKKLAYPLYPYVFTPFGINALTYFNSLGTNTKKISSIQFYSRETNNNGRWRWRKDQAGYISPVNEITSFSSAAIPSRNASQTINRICSFT